MRRQRGRLSPLPAARMIPPRVPREISMDLRYSEADERFRKELRAWLESTVPGHGDPPPHRDWDARRAYDTGWQRKLFDAGY